MNNRQAFVIVQIAAAIVGGRERDGASRHPRLFVHLRKNVT